MIKSELAIIIGDTHFPFARYQDIDRVIEQARRLKPDLILQVGDRHDFYCFSKYARSYNLMTPKQELTRGLKQAKYFWAGLKDASPTAHCVSLLGNHDARLHKRVMERLPELESILDDLSLFSIPGVLTLPSDRDSFSFRINGEEVVAHHGWLSKPGDHARMFLKSAVVGHSHLGGLVHVTRHGGRSFFELNVGYMGDGRSPVFSYGGSKHKPWTLGYGLVDEYGPRFVRLPS
jgi:hypothetical protein